LAGTGRKDSAKACGDPVVIEVLHQAAADLVEFVLLVRTKLRKKHLLLRDGRAVSIVSEYL
jgi:hypothetical protein